MNTPVLFLTQLFGVMFIIIGLSLLFNRKSFKKLIKDFGDSISSLYVSGIVAFILGFYMLFNINSFENITVSILTILGWIIVIKGAFLMMFPGYVKKITGNTKGIIKILPLFGILYILIGAYLSYNGFYL